MFCYIKLARRNAGPTIRPSCIHLVSIHTFSHSVSFFYATGSYRRTIDPTHLSPSFGSTFSIHASSFSIRLRFQHTFPVKAVIFVGMGLLPPFSKHASSFSDSFMFPLSSDGCQKKVAESSIDHSTYFGYWSREPPGPTGRPITDDFQPDLTAETAAIHPITSAVHARVALRTRTQSIDPISSHRPVQKRPHSL